MTRKATTTLVVASLVALVVAVPALAAVIVKVEAEDMTPSNSKIAEFTDGNAIPTGQANTALRWATGGAATAASLNVNGTGNRVMLRAR